MKPIRPRFPARLICLLHQPAADGREQPKKSEGNWPTARPPAAEPRRGEVSGGHQGGPRGVMAQHIYATTNSGCATPLLSPAPALLQPLLPSRLPRRRTSPMGATGHLALCSAAAAKPRSGRGPCAAVLGEPLPALDDAGLLVHPSADFAARALVSSEQQVIIPPLALSRSACTERVARVRAAGVCVCGWS